MIAPTVQQHITIDQLLRIVESIVFLGPITVDELQAHIH
jgi:hypothetical protein